MEQVTATRFAKVTVTFPFMIRKSFVILLVLSLLGLGLGSCNGQQASVKKTPVVVFGAGSLIIPFGDIEKAFEAKYPNIDVRAEYHGSIQVMRHATELHEPIDVVATADASLIPKFAIVSRE